MDDPRPPWRFGEAWTASPVMHRIFELLAQAAPSDATVLLEGETGTGKTLAAETVHAHSRRADRPLVVVDCGALSPRLAEAELFGCAPGSFSGALCGQPGAFELAHGGTLLLDEIGDLPLELQPKLLRVLDKQTVLRIGSTRPIPVDVRVIAATERRLRREVVRGRFRPDLYYRLGVIAARLPPLRERPEDVPLLVSHFYAGLAGEGAAAPAALHELLGRCEWPGNVRELKNAVERAVVLDGVADDDEAAADAGSFRATKDAVIGRWEATFIRSLLHLSKGNVSHAARCARIDRGHLRELMKKYGVELQTE